MFLLHPLTLPLHKVSRFVHVLYKVKPGLAIVTFVPLLFGKNRVKAERPLTQKGRNQQDKFLVLRAWSASTAVMRPKRFPFYLAGFYSVLSGNMGKVVQNS